MRARIVAATVRPLAATQTNADFPAMLRVLSVIALIAVAGGLSGCGDTAPKGAAESAARLLTAALHNDRVAFEAEINRPAVRDDVRRQVDAMAQASALQVDGGPSEFALDRMISPAAVRVVNPQGQRVREPPSAAELGRLMKAVDGQRACVSEPRAPHHCVLTFARDKDHWRLVGMRALDPTVELAAD